MLAMNERRGARWRSGDLGSDLSVLDSIPLRLPDQTESTATDARCAVSLSSAQA